MASKNAKVFVLDHNKSMVDSGNYDKSVQIVTKMLENIMFADRKGDQVGIVIVGCQDGNTESGDNILDVNQLLGFEDLLTQPKVAMLRELQKPLATARGDLSEGINAAMALIKEHTVSKKTGKPLKYEKNIYCFSDGQTEFDTSLLSDSIATLQDEQVDFTMCGFGFEDSQKEELNSDTDAEENSPPLKLSAQQEALLNFVHGKNPDLGSFFTGEEAMAFIDSATTKKVKPTTTYRGSLTFGNAKEHGSAALTMNVFVYPKIMELKLPSAKKISLISRDLTDGGVVQALSTPYLVKENYDSDEDDEEADVDELDREFETVKAYRYGKHLIPFALVDEEAAKLPTVKSMEILYFTAKSNIPRHHYMDNVLAVVPFDDSSKKKFESLFFAAFEQQKVAICRYVRSDNSKPKLGMLVYMSKGYSYFIKLPYEQDFRTKLTPDLGYLRQETVEVVKLEDEPIYKSKKRKHPLDFRTTTLDDANLKIDEFIDSLDLTQQDNFAMPKTIYHPTYQRLTAAISGRALNPDDKIPENVGTGFEVEERPLAESVAHCFKLLQTTTDEDADKNSGDRNLEETTQEMAEETQQVKEEDLINFDSKPPGDAFDIFFD